jgi:hypothetical protein
MNKKPYIPSNGTEGMWFISEWCENCIKHSINPEAKTQCIHLLRSFIENENGQWFYTIKNGAVIPECRAFRSRKEAYKKRYAQRYARQMKQQKSLF